MSNVVTDSPKAVPMPMTTKPRLIYFITGTDTDVGKTVVSSALLARARLLGISAFGVKPITAGCEAAPMDQSVPPDLAKHAGKLISNDALMLQRYASVAIDPMLAAPICLPSPISPHLAAAEVGMSLRAERVVGQVRAALSTRSELVVVEGAGGWRVPINARETIADIAKLLGKPVILVVRIRLGCLSHALLTAEAIQRDGLRLAGWVATVLDTDQSQSMLDAQCGSLEERLHAPCLGVLPYQTVLDVETLAALIRLPHEMFTSD